MTKSCLCIDKRIDIKKLSPKTLLCIGGSRSGKSDFALNFAETFSGKKVYIATMPKTFSNTEKTILHKQQLTSIDHNAKKDVTQNPSQKNEQRKEVTIEKQITDEEVLKRIAKHQAQRGADWLTVEEPLDLLKALTLAKNQNCVIILLDCISLWLTNLIFAGKSEEEILTKVHELATEIQKSEIPIILVSNEVGMGVVPLYQSARLFRDLQGKANQILATTCEAVVQVLFGLPVLLKG